MGFFQQGSLAFLALAAQGLCQGSTAGPTVTVKNGTYMGFYQPSYGQDLFLGMPFAQAPVGDLRFAVAESLNSTWQGNHNATAYYPECVGYGGDDIGYETSEDCLALNVVRPAGMEGQSLPVAVWIHGGGYVMGGTPDRRYNLSFIVANSVEIGKPIIGVSIGYRLSGWGFLDGEEIRKAGATNLGIRDQRLALHWLQENIAAFGGDPSKVTIWGESAGAEAVGIHLTAYGGRDDKIFRGAMGESGTFILQGGKYNISVGQGIYDNITAATGCSNTSDTLTCLKSVSFEKLNSAFNTTPSLLFQPFVDGDLIQGSNYEQVLNGSFVKVPYLIGTNSDEGSAFGLQGINNDSDFMAYMESTGADAETVKTLMVVYPNIPALGVLDTVTYTPNSTWGSQFKRSAAFGGDFTFIAARRLTCETWAQHNLSAYCYRFNVIVNGIPPIIGSTHFQEVAFVFHNTQGLGYAIDPFGGKPPSFFELSKLMTGMWAAFVHDGDPNGHGVIGVPEWPVYNNGAGGYGQDFVFDANVTSHPEPDVFRGAAIAYMNTLWASQFGK